MTSDLYKKNLIDTIWYMTLNWIENILIICTNLKILKEIQPDFHVEIICHGIIATIVGVHICVLIYHIHFQFGSVNSANFSWFFRVSALTACPIKQNRMCRSTDGEWACPDWWSVSSNSADYCNSASKWPWIKLSTFKLGDLNVSLCCKV